MKKIFLLFFTLTVCLFGQNPVGNGTSTCPYLIATPADLAAIPTLGLDKHYRLVQDIDLSGWGEWTPIGNSTTPFSGVFDGAFHTISGMRITTGIGVAGSYGLFGQITGISTTSVTRIIFRDCIIAQDDFWLFADNNYGILVGLLTNTNTDGIRDIHLRQCSVKVEPGGGNFNPSVGGIIGRASFALGVVVTRFSVDSSHIRSYQAYIVSNVPYVGGLIGNAGGFAATITESWVANSLIEGRRGTTAGQVYLGGFISTQQNNDITNSYVKNISVVNTAASMQGGVFIYSSNLGKSQTHNYAVGTVSGSVNGYIYENDNVAVNLVNNFFDSDVAGTTNGQTTGSGTPPTAKTTVQMKDEASYSGWNFTTIWDIDPERNSGYPFLRNNPPDILPEVVPLPTEYFAISLIEPTGGIFSGGSTMIVEWGVSACEGAWSGGLDYEVYISVDGGGTWALADEVEDLLTTEVTLPVLYSELGRIKVMNVQTQKFAISNLFTITTSLLLNFLSVEQREEGSSILDISVQSIGFTRLSLFWSFTEGDWKLGLADVVIDTINNSLIDTTNIEWILPSGSGGKELYLRVANAIDTSKYALQKDYVSIGGLKPSQPQVCWWTIGFFQRPLYYVWGNDPACWWQFWCTSRTVNVYLNDKATGYTVSYGAGDCCFRENGQVDCLSCEWDDPKGAYPICLPYWIDGDVLCITDDPDFVCASLSNPPPPDGMTLSLAFFYPKILIGWSGLPTSFVYKGYEYYWNQADSSVYVNDLINEIDNLLYLDLRPLFKNENSFKRWTNAVGMMAYNIQHTKLRGKNHPTWYTQADFEALNDPDFVPVFLISGTNFLGGETVRASTLPFPYSAEDITSLQITTYRDYFRGIHPKIRKH